MQVKPPTSAQTGAAGADRGDLRDDPERQSTTQCRPISPDMLAHFADIESPVDLSSKGQLRQGSTPISSTAFSEVRWHRYDGSLLMHPPHVSQASASPRSWTSRRRSGALLIACHWTHCACGYRHGYQSHTYVLELGVHGSVSHRSSRPYRQPNGAGGFLDLRRQSSLTYSMQAGTQRLQNLGIFQMALVVGISMIAL